MDYMLFGGVGITSPVTSGTSTDLAHDPWKGTWTTKQGYVTLGGVQGREVQEGMMVWRVYGQEQGPYGVYREQDSRPMGSYWTDINPSHSSNYRNDAGLPDENAGRFTIEAIIADTAGIQRTPGGASSVGGNQGGWSELRIPDPDKQLSVKNVSGNNPKF